MAQSRLFDWAALIFLGSLWGMTIPLTKIAVSTGHQPLGLIFWQFLIAVICLTFLSLIRRIPIDISWANIRFYAVICLLGTLVPNSFSYLAAAQLPAGIMGILIASVPMFALAISLLLKIEGFEIRRFVGVVLGLVAVVIIVAPDTSLLDPQKAIFVLVALIAPFCYGCETNYLVVRSPENINPVSTLLMASLIGLAISTPLAWFSGSWVDLTAMWDKPEYAVLMSGLLHVFAYCGYIWLVGKTGAVFSSQIAYVVTMAGVFLSGLFLGESYSQWVWLALAIMMLGISLVRPKEEPSH